MRRGTIIATATATVVAGFGIVTTAVGAQPASFGATLTPTAVEPGGTFTVTGEGCDQSLAGAVVLDGGTGIGVGDTLTPEGDGTFVIELTLPGDVEPGAALTVQVDCGSELETLYSVDLPLEVLGAATTTTASPAPAAAAAAAPSFTG